MPERFNALLSYESKDKPIVRELLRIAYLGRQATPGVTLLLSVSKSTIYG